MPVDGRERAVEETGKGERGKLAADGEPSNERPAVALPGVQSPPAKGLQPSW